MGGLAVKGQESRQPTHLSVSVGYRVLGCKEAVTWAGTTSRLGAEMLHEILQLLVYLPEEQSVRPRSLAKSSRGVMTEARSDKRMYQEIRPEGFAM